MHSRVDEERMTVCREGQYRSIHFPKAAASIPAVHIAKKSALKSSELVRIGERSMTCHFMPDERSITCYEELIG